MLSLSQTIFSFTESVTNLLGHNVKISLKCLVKLEIKPEKMETKILAFSACRLFILSAKIPSKIEQSFHYMDIVAIESKKLSHLLLTVNLTPNETTKTLSFHSMDPEDGEEINLMIIQLGTAIKTIFPQVPLEYIIRRIDVFPESRLHAMIEYNEAIEKKAKDSLPATEAATFGSLSNMSPLINPCGNYSTQYACMCDYFNLPYREEVSWDVDTIYFSHNITELSLLDFEHLDSKDLVPIIAALAFNGYFTKFRASGVKIIGGSSGNRIDPEVGEQIVNLMKKSFTLEEVYLDNTGIKADFVNKLMLALLSNSHSNLHTIDLSHNTIEDKGIKTLCGFVAKINTTSPDSSATNPHPHKGLVHLNLSHTGLTSKGISELAEALSLNKALPSTLTYLNLSENVFKDDVNKLYNFLAQPNNIVSLDLSGTECCLDTIFGALLRGCTQKLAQLNLSRNQFCKKSHKEVTVLPSFKNFFTSTVSLKSINLSGNRLPIEALKSMLLGLACNEIASDIYINLSSNDFKSGGASVIEMVISDIRCLSGIDLSDNGFDTDVAGVITAISKNKSLKRLSIGKNFNNIKPKHMPRVLESLVLLLQDEESSLESLSIADSKLRTDTCLVINALSNNQSLVNIDITGNHMGLPGAKTLAKALQVNSKLESIFMDRNMVPTVGFIDIAYALERNFTLKHLPIPIQDITTAIKFGSPEKTEAAIAKIEELLRRNNAPHPFLRNRGLHSGSNAAQHHFSYDSGTYQMIDKLMVHLQDILSNWSVAGKGSIGSFRLKKNVDSSISSSESIDSKAEHVHKAESYLKEAINAKQLFTRLHQQFILGLPSTIDSNVSPSKPVDSKLHDFVFELKSTLENNIQETTALMLQCVQEQCPNVILNSEKLQHDLQRIHSNSINSRHFPSLSFLQNCLIEQVGSMINYKMEEVLLAIATHICDRVLDEVIECLSSSHRTLTESGTVSTMNQRSSTPDVLRTRTGTWFDAGSSKDSSTEGNLSSVECRGDMSSKEDSDNFGMATPKLPNQKRQSLYTRRLRPQSVMDGIATDEIPDLLPKAESTSGVSSIPFDSTSSNSSGDKLEHLGKSRPKRTKTRAPTRAAIISTGKVKKIEMVNENSDSNEHLDDGLDSFFRKPIIEPIKPSVLPNSKLGLNRSFLSCQNDKLNSDKFHFNQKSPADEMSTSLIVEQTSAMHQIGASHIYSRVDEVTRSRSSPNLGVRKQHQQQGPGVATTPEIPRNDSPGAEEVANILNRVSSPIPPEQHSELLAEMKAKGGKRSLAPTPTPQATTEETNVVSSSSVKTASSSTTTNAFGVRLRASTFGDVLKSPSKSSIKNEESSSIHEVPPKANGTKQSQPPSNSSSSSKQRPKSVVGLLGAKFEMGSEVSVDAVSESSENAQCSESIISGAKCVTESGPIDNKGQVKKTLAVFGGNASSSTSGSDFKPISRSKFYTSSSLSSNLQPNNKNASNN
ncbi:leucine-rich repeat-containing protein 16A-like protein [Dinothrombium tinctorium]|uniref:Leucine-rich repeat-containing protein 16A-like protein n=1 Tax=Dinothrombium tinctorium TaxID=1965070 RepID=A0A443RFV6_9ACAR|nr:leucine-rich repeat-containing protein 16A-like protein [Dinothrombium tinctorium]